MTRWLVIYLLLANVVTTLWYSVQYRAQIAKNVQEVPKESIQSLILISQLTPQTRDELTHEK